MKKMLNILFFTSLISFLINIIAMPFLPNEIPMHYNINGEIDRIGNKIEIFIFPVLILLITLFFVAIIKYYKKLELKVNNEKEKQKYIGNSFLLLRFAIMLNFIYIMMNLYYLFVAMNIFSSKSLNAMSGVVLALVLIAAGIATKNAGRNSFFGVRTKWSLFDDYCFDKSNKLGANLLIIAGIFIALLFIISSYNKIFIVISILTVVVFILVIYSYYVYKKRKRFLENNS